MSGGGYMRAGGQRGPWVPPEPKPRPAHPRPQIPEPKPMQMHVHPEQSDRRRVNQSMWIFRDLRDDIVSGVYAPGARLPSMHVLGERYGVTESVAQEAASRLRELGLVRTVPGRGTWVVDAITDRAAMRTALDAARSGAVPAALFADDAGPMVMFPAAWIARLLDDSEAPERLT